MLLVLDKNGALPEHIIDTLRKLEDGRWLIRVNPLSVAKDARSYQDQYFAMVDAVRDHTGDSRYTIHERFKAHQKVETTTNFNIQDWVTFIDAFKWKQFNDLDLIL